MNVFISFLGIPYIIRFVAGSNNRNQFNSIEMFYNVSHSYTESAAVWNAAVVFTAVLVMLIENHLFSSAVSIIKMVRGCYETTSTWVDVTYEQK